MPDETQNPHDSVGWWAKRYYHANRAALEAALRPYGLGSTQWYVLYQLATDGPTMQRDLAQWLRLERATLSGIVATLVRKGLIDQVADAVDQRQRVLRMTDAGMTLWVKIPDLVEVLRASSFQDASEADLATTVSVLQAATKRLNDFTSDGMETPPVE